MYSGEGGTQPCTSHTRWVCSQERPRGWCPGNATTSPLAPSSKPSSAPIPPLSAACLMDGKLSSSPPPSITTTSPALSSAGSEKLGSYSW